MTSRIGLGLEMGREIEARRKRRECPMFDGTMCESGGERSEIGSVMTRLDSTLINLRSSIDTLQARLVMVTKDREPEVTPQPGAVDPPAPPASQLVLELREFCERCEGMVVQVQSTLERLEV